MDGEIVVWYIAEGDKFKEGQAILEVETDKATIPYNATEEGYLAKILIPSGKSKVRSSSHKQVSEFSPSEGSTFHYIQTHPFGRNGA